MFRITKSLITQISTDGTSQQQFQSSEILIETQSNIERMHSVQFFWGHWNPIVADDDRNLNRYYSTKWRFQRCPNSRQIHKAMNLNRGTVELATNSRQKRSMKARTTEDVVCVKKIFVHGINFAEAYRAYLSNHGNLSNTNIQCIENHHLIVDFEYSCFKPNTYKNNR